MCYKPNIVKWPNIGTVFWATVCVRYSMYTGGLYLEQKMRRQLSSAVRAHPRPGVYGMSGYLWSSNVQSLKKLSQCLAISQCLVYNTMLRSGINLKKIPLIVYYIGFRMTPYSSNLDKNWQHNKLNKLITHWDSFLTYSPGFTFYLINTWYDHILPL